MKILNKVEHEIKSCGLPPSIFIYALSTKPILPLLFLRLIWSNASFKATLSNLYASNSRSCGMQSESFKGCICFFNNTCRNSWHLAVQLQLQKHWKRCEMCSRLTPERCHWLSSGVFFVGFKHISSLCLVFLLLTLNK